MWDNKPTFVEWGSVTIMVTGIKEAGYTEIQPLLCHFEEAVAVMTRLVLRVVSCYWQVQQEKLCHCHWDTHTLSSLSDSWVLWIFYCGNFHKLCHNKKKMNFCYETAIGTGLFAISISFHRVYKFSILQWTKMVNSMMCWFDMVH